MKSILKIIALLALSLFVLCTQVEFNNPLDPKASNYDVNKAKDEDGNGKADYYEDEDQDGKINGNDSDWKNYIKDLEPPEFSMKGGDVVSVNSKTENVLEKYTAFKNQVKATDSKDGDVSNRISIDPVDVSSLIDSTYDVIFIVKDFDNNADTIHRTFKVYTPADVDTVGPRIINLPDTLPFYVGDAYRAPLVTAFDVVDQDVSSSIEITGTVNMEKEGVYPMVYTATDKSGNPTTKTLYVKVLPGTTTGDQIFPIITLTGGKDTIKLANGAEWVDPGYDATDNKDGNIKEKVTVDTSSFNVKRVDVVCKVTYRVTDNAGNTTTEYRYVLFGTVATVEPPRFFLVGEPVTTKEIAYSINLNGTTKTLTAKDKDGLDISSSITRTGTFDSTKTGNYTLNYSVKDKDFVEATLKVAITVANANNDTTKPVIKLKGKNPDTVGVDSVNKYEDPGASAADFINGISKTVTVKVNGSVDRTKIGSYTLTYTAIDDAGNQTDSIRTVVVRDFSNNLLLKYSVPGTAPLKTINKNYTSFSIDGNGPAFSTMKSMSINWAYNEYNKELYSFSITSKTDQYIDLKSTENDLKSTKPSVTFATIPGITDLTGKFWVTVIDTEMIWVEETGKFAIIWKP